MSEQVPDAHLAALRGQAILFLFEHGFSIGEHEGATIVERPRYSAAFLDFLLQQAGDDANPLLFASAEAKLRAITVVRTSPYPSDRVDFRVWRHEVIKRAWLIATEEPLVDAAHQLAAAMQGSNAHEAALDTLVALTVAAEQFDQLSLEDNGV